MKQYTVFKVQAHMGESPEGHLMDICVLTLIDDNAENALKRAKKMIKKKFYRVSEITEYYDKS